MPDLVPPLAPAPDWLAGSSSTSREGPRTEPSNKESRLDGAALRPSRRVPLCATTGRHDGRRGLTRGRDERVDRYRTAPDRNSANEDQIYPPPQSHLASRACAPGPDGVRADSLGEGRIDGS